MISLAQVNRPDVVAELMAAFTRYENALISNNVGVLDEMFWDSKFTLRYGIGENLYGIDAIRAFRLARSPAGLDRSLHNTVITTYGEDYATANTEFRRDGQPVGRQSQTWVRLPEGWRIVAAHVSYMK